MIQEQEAMDMPQAKRVRTSVPDFAPLHLGGDNYVFISDFANTIRVHIRQYRMDDQGHLRPTKRGVSLPPALWFSLTNHLHPLSDTIVVQDNLVIATNYLDGIPHITLQRYFKCKDMSRKFSPNTAVLTAQEWEKLGDLKDTIAENITAVMFGTTFCNTINTEARKRSPNWTTDLPDDIAAILDTSLITLVESQLGECIKKLFKCRGCEQACENQLGHECLYTSHQDLINRYGLFALANMDFKNMAQNFVEQNVHIANYITANYLAKTDFKSLWKSAQELFIANDPIFNFSLPFLEL